MTISNRSFVYSLQHLLTLYRRANIKNAVKSTHILLYHLKGYNTAYKKYVCAYGKNFIVHKNQFSIYAKNKSDECNTSEEHSDDDNDKLFLNDNESENDAEEEQEQKYSKTKRPCNNSENSDQINKHISDKQNFNEQVINSPTEITKKSKYDSDVILIYEDLPHLSSDMLSPHLSEEEIEQVNSGIPDFPYDNYSNNIAYNKKIKK
ncbi:conserved Plasmodium protein, unknown function [Plasmodium malariae]|uniref:Uncharacterized protein n=1 Tax=Plasmodium malariae TaxID=5858 RepID=A0A1C3KFP3_PLAMA|nr:conserved Plasmodium protein, unknown function [Plasmodium malariae]